MSWIEARLSRAAWQLKWVYKIADEHSCTSIHHFFEPWHKTGPVVRIRASKKALRSLTAVIESSDGCSVVAWDATPDERLFAEDWPNVQRLFEAASRLALTSPGVGCWRDRKLVHCALNALGYGLNDEVNFDATFFKERLRMKLHWLSWRWFPLGRGNCALGCHRVEWRTR